jgi:nicotinamidase-related amidase
MTLTGAALLLIDFQQWIVREFTGSRGTPAARSAGLAATRARSRGDLVVHVRYLRPADDPTAEDVAFLDCLDVVAGDEIVSKHGRSAFDGTDLDVILRRERVHRIGLAGVVTEGGVEATVRSAKKLGYTVAVLGDAVTGHSRSRHEQALHRMQRTGVDVVPAERWRS